MLLNLTGDNRVYATEFSKYRLLINCFKQNPAEYFKKLP